MSDRLDAEQRRLVEISKQMLMAREQARELEAAQQRQLGRIEMLRELDAEDAE